MLSILLSLAFAQDTIEDADIPPIDVQHFRPSLNARHTLWTDDSARGAHKRFFARPLFHYTRQPLVYEYDDGRSLALVKTIIQGDLMAGFSYDRVAFGVNLPLYFFADGDDRPSQSGIGDLAVDAKVTVLDGGDGPGVAVNARLDLPTASISDKFSLGNQNPGWEIAGIVDQKLGDKFMVLGNIGLRGGNKAELENVTLNDFFTFRAAGAYLINPTSGAALEVAGSVPFTSNVVAGMPIEVMLDGYTAVAPDLTLRAGIGTSLTSAVAAPDLRVLLGFEWRPQPDTDRDDDGIDDAVDACPDVPEDKDGEDDEDGCVDDIGRFIVKVVGPDGKPVPNVKVEVGKTKGTDGLEAKVPSGAYTVKAMAEGFEPGEMEVDVVDADDGREVQIKLTKVEIPMGVLKIRVEDVEGEVIENAKIELNGKEVAGGSMEESVEAGDYKLRAMADGFKPSGKQNKTVAKDGTVEVVFTLEPAKAELKGERIDLRDRVYFDTAKATIQDRSFGLLDEVVAILGDHPELTKLRIEGHTDSRGSASYNKRLSQQRADSVMAYLVGKGVKAERLSAVGFGEEKPLDDRQVEEAWTKNRRVDFFVAERSD